MLSKFIKERLQDTLPGEHAHREMAPLGRYSISPKNLNPKKAGVAVVYTPDEDLGSIIFIQRSTVLEDVHSGQISFPGGKFDAKYDNDLLDCALRELREEIGLSLSQENFLGPLSELFIPVSNFMVFPYVLLLKSRLEVMEIDRREVSEVFELPVSHLLQEANVDRREMVTSTGVKIKDVPCYTFRDKIIWGATAMITSEFLRIFKESTKHH